MFLGEPEQTPYDLHFSLFGIPIRVHPMFWLISVLLGGLSGTPIQTLIWVVAVFLAILVHELGHALTMRYFGFQPWIVLYQMGGMAVPGPRGPSSARGYDTVPQILITLAGPFAGFALAALVVAGVAAAGHWENVHFGNIGNIVPKVEGIGRPMLAFFLNDLTLICIFWGILNLMPVYPLDGGQVARNVLLAFDPRDGIRHSLMLSIATGALIAIYSALQFHDIFMSLLFGYLAYQSYVALQMYGTRRR